MCLEIFLRLAQGCRDPATDDNAVVDTDTVTRFKDLLRLVDGVKDTDDETTAKAITCLNAFLQLISPATDDGGRNSEGR